MFRSNKKMILTPEKRRPALGISQDTQWTNIFSRAIEGHGVVSQAIFSTIENIAVVKFRSSKISLATRRGAPQWRARKLLFSGCLGWFPAPVCAFLALISSFCSIETLCSIFFFVFKRSIENFIFELLYSEKQKTPRRRASPSTEARALGPRTINWLMNTCLRGTLGRNGLARPETADAFKNFMVSPASYVRSDGARKCGDADRRSVLAVLDIRIISYFQKKQYSGKYSAISNPDQVMEIFINSINTRKFV